ncbi:16S rRNA (guanine(527)-N(7))-methyltransferase RsmG [Abyssisolibacter fermentans]|uniref:16S rRNA (guanine(527)-N(7))-methyltransferase RsmG n=1 Tax=Abyssisolibacter fermentans TaxID=1766203 RepID=UPI00082ACFF9|nr:16S rRNA (guanine(527)-N(7))-methyltransferase RsmG [Abyssisolibacter fermentans]
MNKVKYLVDSAKSINVSLDEKSIEKFDKYKEILKEWNKKMNLTALKEDEDIEIKHFIDSLTILELEYIKDNDKVIDVGTGAGFPGIPLKIVNETIDLTLMDSLNKRINFLSHLVNELNLESVKCKHSRAEELARDKEYREKFDIVVSRAVARLNILCEYCIPFVKKGGYFIAMKGPDVESEVEEASKAIKVLGCKIEEVKKIILPLDNIVHSLIVIKKISNTSTKYPRNPGIPKKNPII